MVLNDTETVNTMLMDTGFTKMCLAAKCTAVQTIMDMLKNTKQVWVLRGGAIINREAIKSGKSTVNAGIYSNRSNERHVRDRRTEKERQTEAGRSLVLHCKALAPGRVRG